MNELKNNNALLFSTIQSLKEMNYPDPERVSAEICEFCEFDEADVKKVLNRLKNDEPWEHIQGYTYFFGHKFYVDQNVLIPRIETEKLVERVIQQFSNRNEKIEFVDVGTGSGCIIISLYLALKDKEDFKFTAVEKYKNAKKVAQKNIEYHDADIELIQSNLLKKYPTISTDRIVFVANLPYLTEDQIKKTDRSVSKYEPNSALVGGGNDGLNIIMKFLNQSKEVKTPHTIYLEIDPSQVEQLKIKIPEIYQIIEVIKDQYDRDRFVHLESV